ncbi:MAG: type II toxin-antitoxin system HicB family antitoxin [Candidatus Omnitrophica bacterium]|nr:type II toxin-antitoxin system HicB family antitoxin [Candidatus Omnitrophota bacterium]
MSYRLSAIIEREGEWYVALCPELGIASQGRTIEEAKHNLHEAVQPFLETADPAEITIPTEAPFITTFEVVI